MLGVAGDEVDTALDAVVEQVRAALLEDLDAGFAELVREYQQLVYTTVLRVCRHHDDAEDLAAEVFLRAYRALRTYEAAAIGVLRPRAWLVTIALNLGRNELRNRGRRPRQVAFDVVPDGELQRGSLDAFDEIAGRLDHREALAELTACLPERQRVAVLLRHLCGLSSPEVAEILGCPEGTARSHVSRGLTTLRALLVERYPGLAADLPSPRAAPSPAAGRPAPPRPARGKERPDGNRRG